MIIEGYQIEYWEVILSFKATEQYLTHEEVISQALSYAGIEAEIVGSGMGHGIRDLEIEIASKDEPDIESAFAKLTIPELTWRLQVTASKEQ